MDRNSSTCLGTQDRATDAQGKAESSFRLALQVSVLIYRMRVVFREVFGQSVESFGSFRKDSARRSLARRTLVLIYRRRRTST